MASQVLYRKWRPRTFEEVVGQEHVIRTLRNALRSGRVAHAYLFAGPRGTGKTTTARILAKAVNCLSEDERPCNRCRICKAIDERRCLDLIEIDAASNTGVDDIRNLREKVNFAPSEARYKVYILDEAHMLSTSAFNALLKTLEEPPPHVIFVLVTTEPHKFPLTILSRCQRFDFRRIPLSDIVARLERIAEGESLSVESAALKLIARSATGSMRDAESLLDQLMAYGSEITLAQVRSGLGTAASQAVEELVSHLVANDVPKGLALVERVMDDGVDLRQFGQQVVERLRGLLLIKLGSSDLVDFPAETLQEMKEQAAKATTGELVRAVKLFNRAGHDLKGGLQPQLPLELAFIEATQAKEEIPPPEPSNVPSPSPAERRKPSAKVKEAPSPQPTRPPSAADEGSPPGEMSLQAMKGNWGRILSGIKPHNRSVEALLKSCQPMAVEGEAVVLGFYYAFHKEKIEEPKSKALVEKIIGQVMGHPCRIRCVLSPKGQAPEPAEQKKPQDKHRDLTEDPLVKAAVERYGAKVVNAT
ncbi:MAG: DNA polymerase III subunit gamma/tau [Chloroflexota bacterium]|nr:DNA polymerase III subunit gamma/tau [Chloroflexota bacterium]